MSYADEIGDQDENIADWFLDNKEYKGYQIGNQYICYTN